MALVDLWHICVISVTVLPLHRFKIYFGRSVLDYNIVELSFYVLSFSIITTRV